MGNTPLKPRLLPPRSKRCPGSFDRELGRRIRLQRVLRGMSQRELGETMGVSMQQVQKYERGSNRLCAYRLLQVAHFLLIPATALLYGSEEEPPLSAPSRTLRDLYRLSRRLRPAQQKQLGKLAASMAARNARRGASARP